MNGGTKARQNHEKLPCYGCGSRGRTCDAGAKGRCLTAWLYHISGRLLSWYVSFQPMNTGAHIVQEFLFGCSLDASWLTPNHQAAPHRSMHLNKCIKATGMSSISRIRDVVLGRQFQSDESSMGDVPTDEEPIVLAPFNSWLPTQRRWCARWDSNPQPTAYEAAALTGWATGTFITFV